jgi:hypothetical protein
LLLATNQYKHFRKVCGHSEKCLQNKISEHSI